MNVLDHAVARIDRHRQFTGPGMETECAAKVQTADGRWWWITVRPYNKVAQRVER